MTVVNYKLDRFFEYFHSKGFDLLVLRGYEGLPQEYGGDLDLEIPKDQYRRYIRELINFAKMEELQLFKYVYRPHVTSFKFFRKSGGVIERFILDIASQGGSWYGCTYLTNEELFYASNKLELWRVPCLLHELVLKIFTNMLIGSKPPYKYFCEIKQELPLIKNEFMEFVYERFPKVNVEKLYSALIESDTLTLKNMIPKMKRKLLMRSFKQNNIKFFRQVLATIFSELYFYLQKNGMVIGINCSYLPKQERSRWKKEIELTMGHIWKKVDLCNIGEMTRWAHLLSRAVMQLEMFRDRLIWIWTDDTKSCGRCDGMIICTPRGKIDNDPQTDILKLIEISSNSSLGLVSYWLYNTLIQRTRKRFKSRLYRNFLFSLLGYREIYSYLVQEKQGEDNNGTA
ncbi:MAG: hypothetical protein D6748_06335 [Calditrichaeota bacterium]|nr:MAG: hypothetical protein D6748_06335 [Calditrichota bacterium]